MESGSSVESGAGIVERLLQESKSENKNLKSDIDNEGMSLIKKR